MGLHSGMIRIEKGSNSGKIGMRMSVHSGSYQPEFQCFSALPGRNGSAFRYDQNPVKSEWECQYIPAQINRNFPEDETFQVFFQHFDKNAKIMARAELLYHDCVFDGGFG